MSLERQSYLRSPRSRRKKRTPHPITSEARNDSIVDGSGIGAGGSSFLLSPFSSLLVSFSPIELVGLNQIVGSRDAETIKPESIDCAFSMAPCADFNI